MKNTLLSPTKLTFIQTPSLQKKQIEEYQELISYYQEATEDYRFWSENYHMHFGFYKRGMNPFDLETMLLQMTKEVFERLEIIQAKEKRIVSNQEIKAIDLGCGVGTSARYFAQIYPFAKITAVTLLKEQIELGKYLIQKEIKEGIIKNKDIQENINFVQTDYTNTPFMNKNFDAAYAIESSCHAKGKDKFELLKETSRILKSGGRLVIADGFLKHGNKLPFLVEKAYQKTCQCWAVPEMAQLNPFIEALEKLGFENIKVEDMSWKVAPSVAHVPYITLKFFLKQIKLKSIQNLHQERKNNVFAPLMTMFLGLARKHFSYYIISATKK